MKVGKIVYITQKSNNEMYFKANIDGEIHEIRLESQMWWMIKDYYDGWLEIKHSGVLSQLDEYYRKFSFRRKQRKQKLSRILK